MKKILFTLILGLFAIAAHCETQHYLGTEYALANVNKYGTYSWSQWYDSNVLIVINTDTDIVTIGSKKPQLYKIYKYEGKTFDNGGGYQVIFDVIDNEGDLGTLRIRVQYDAFGNITNAQLYIDFSNVAWVYNIIPLDE